MFRFPLLSSLVVAAAMFIPLVAHSAACPTYATGQVLCYSSGGAVIDCAGTGQDGDMRAGVP